MFWRLDIGIAHTQIYDIHATFSCRSLHFIDLSEQIRRKGFYPIGVHLSLSEDTGDPDAAASSSALEYIRVRGFMLTIRDLIRWLPESIIELYESAGIQELYPPQADAIERGLLDGRNMIISVPTAAGKRSWRSLRCSRALSLALEHCT